MKKIFSFFLSKLWPFIEPLLWFFAICLFTLHVPELYEAGSLFNSGEGEPFVLFGAVSMLSFFCICWFIREVFTFLFSLFRKSSNHISDSGPG